MCAISITFPPVVACAAGCVGVIARCSFADRDITHPNYVAERRSHSCIVVVVDVVVMKNTEREAVRSQRPRREGASPGTTRCPMDLTPYLTTRTRCRPWPGNNPTGCGALPFTLTVEAWRKCMARRGLRPTAHAGGHRARCRRSRACSGRTCREARHASPGWS